MSDNLYLTKMTQAIAEAYFKDFVTDPAVLLDGQPVQKFCYSEEWVAGYLRHHKDCVHLAIMLINRPIGEILFKRIDSVGKTAVLSIHLQNDSVKGKGHGTQAEKLAIAYAFEVMGLNTLYADAVKTNLRSIHVLEKAGFTFCKEDDEFVYYELQNPYLRR